jgi:hypothetical protein
MKTVKISLYQAVEARRGVEGRDFHIFYTLGLQMAVRFSALRAGHPLAHRKISGTHFC